MCSFCILNIKNPSVYFTLYVNRNSDSFQELNSYIHLATMVDSTVIESMIYIKHGRDSEVVNMF